MKLMYALGGVGSVYIEQVTTYMFYKYSSRSNILRERLHHVSCRKDISNCKHHIYRLVACIIDR